MHTEIRGKRVVLRPTVEADCRTVYDWLANSDVTPLMLGPPKFPDHPVPTWEEFCADYVPHYFDDKRPETGRGFIIVADDEDIGCIAYNELDFPRGETELDVWLRSTSLCGKGYGTDALCTLCEYLTEQYHVSRFIIRPSRRNTAAIAAYKHAGFHECPLDVAEQEAVYGKGDYGDSVLLIKTAEAGAK